MIDLIIYLSRVNLHPRTSSYASGSRGEETNGCENINRSRTHTHTPTENNTPDTDTHTHTHTRQEQHPKPPRTPERSTLTQGSPDTLHVYIYTYQDVKRSTLTQQPTVPWSSLLQSTPRPCHTCQLSNRIGETTRNYPDGSSEESTKLRHGTQLG